MPRFFYGFAYEVKEPVFWAVGGENGPAKIDSSIRFLQSRHYRQNSLSGLWLGQDYRIFTLTPSFTASPG